MIPIDFDPNTYTSGEWALNWYLTVVLAIIAIGIIFAIGWTIFADEIEGDVVFGSILGSTIAGLMWPILIGIVAPIMGLRFAVQAIKKKAKEDKEESENVDKATRKYNLSDQEIDDMCDKISYLINENARLQHQLVDPMNPYNG